MSYNPRDFKVKNSRDLNHLHPIVKEKSENFLKKANDFLKKEGLEVKVISTLRTFEEQQALYNIGRIDKTKKIVTKAKPGRSIHNWGCAIDLGVFKGKEYLDATNSKKAVEVYKTISKFAEEEGFFWGGNFSSFSDNPHFQYTGNYSNNEFLDKANSGVSIDILLKI